MREGAAQTGVRVDRGEQSVDVLIVGAGPVGLTLANLLGVYGLAALVVERADSLIDYPRGVGMDDECLRVFQAVGLVDRVREHTTPDQWLRFMTAKGRCFASVEPRTREFGWPRRSAFIQPLVDKVLYEGTRRFAGVEVRFGHTLTAFEETAGGIQAEVSDAAGAIHRLAARFVVGCDGGRSAVRKVLDISFEGQTESTRWVVVDIKNDPIGIPDAYLHCVPARPYVTMALPHGLRRCEFMVLPDETDEALCSPEGTQRLLSIILPNPEMVEVVRSRVYTHHARLAGRFRMGSAMLAGDAAHLMPVWQGQGFNSGIRDANNIAWKIAAVVQGLAGDGLLDSYDQERREHAAAMISLSVLAGRIFSPTGRWLGVLRDGVTLLLNAIPSVKNYILQMRFKPMPRYEQGAVVHVAAGSAIAKTSPVGRLFIQPFVITSEGQSVRFDDAIGPWFAIVAWAVDPRRYMDADSLAFWQRMGARFVTIIPVTQMKESLRGGLAMDDNLLILGDADQDLKEWFGRHRAAVVVLRPDRFVAAAATPLQISSVTRQLMAIFGGKIGGCA
jgi:3-(3-hydroxy-phenyl)propionate hydroxylase